MGIISGARSDVKAARLIGVLTAILAIGWLESYGILAALFLGAAAAVLLSRTPANVGGLRGFVAKLAYVGLFLLAVASGPVAAA